MRILLFSILFALCESQRLEKARSVWVEQGLVRGNIFEIEGVHMQMFRGIPYAEPPINDLRFKKPVKKARWHQELSATEYGPPCLQFMDFHKNDKFAKDNMEKQSEDCLYLNVFSPYDNDDESKTYPILVWIHGGSFLAGSGDTGIDINIVAKNLVKRGIAFVSINYRLGPLGFLNYPNGEKLDGNFGIWDMVMALQWIQANMKQFNGDPSNVTIMGESAGGAASSLLALSPKTQGLVHRAIIMSGSSLAGWAVHRHSQPAYAIDNIVQYLRCQKFISESDTREVVGDEYQNLMKKDGKVKLCNYQHMKINCLTADMQLDTKLDCLRKELNFTNALFRKALATELGVSKMVVDGDLIPSSGVTLAELNARIPIMTGVARKEWGHKKPLFYNMHQKGGLTRNDVSEQIYRIIDNNFHETTSEKMSNSTVQLLANATLIRYTPYLSEPSKGFNANQVVGALQKIESDIEFVAPCQREIEAYAERGVKVFAYSFDYVPMDTIYETERKVFALFGDKAVEIKRTEKEKNDLKEAFHGLDHAFIFTKGYTSNFEIEPYSKKDERMSQLLCSMITNFVKTGDPSTQRFSWPAYTVNSTQHVSINIPPKLVDGDIHWPDANFWNVEAELISKYIAIDAETAVNPDADLTNEERVQLSAYRRSWYALWVIVIVLSLILWSFVGYCTYHKSKSARNKPYDNILLPK
ncbi:unnamed protein product [Caenorhabditis angaria]|uniref:Carboxylesterase type B domain-containing protein n=1 Tax=Caenorhabditis angaria TaxID=860376 RepID=A0A9P1N9A9_9PELO|nr:unnamed protein product [Caenorhabditis angaria]